MSAVETPPMDPNPALAVPRLDARHTAMLAEMGVPIWWDVPSEPAAAAHNTAPKTPTHAPPARGLELPGGAPRRSVPPASSVPPEPERPQPAIASRTPSDAPQRSSPTPVPAGALDTLDHAALDACIRDCQRCALAQQRQHAVPGMGDPAPDWLIVGEAPGEEEDRQGQPFVGRAGQLLDRMLAAMDLTRERHVYIANVIKCRPPRNRNPEPDEIAQCAPYLLRQVQLLRPKVVLAMGRFAAQTLLGEGGALDAETLRQIPLGRLRGRVHRVQLGGLELPVVVTYHPAYLLRSPAEKAKTWADLCLALETMDGIRRGGTQAAAG